MVWQPQEFGDQVERWQEVSAAVVRAKHIRGAQLCMSGARGWFESYGLSWADFLENGITVEQLRALNDPLGNRVADFAETHQQGGSDGE